MGITTNTSFFLGKPTIGVAQNYYHIEGAEFVLPDNYEGACTEIVKNGEIYGQVLRTHQDVKPIFISCGNWIDIETSQKFVLEFVTKESRLPVTTRYADILTHKERKRLSGIYKWLNDFRILILVLIVATFPEVRIILRDDWSCSSLFVF